MVAVQSLRPSPLKPGDVIRFVTPASPLAREKISDAITLFESWGFTVQLAPHALDRTDYLAGPDVDRANDLREAFEDPEVSAVYCTRGGYGCARLFPYLDLDLIAGSRKLFLGFSDITTLHLALNKRGLATVHAPMALTLATRRSDWVYESLRRSLVGENPIPPDAPTGECLVDGSAEGEVVGGCLCLICDSLGTPEELDFAGKIVLIEDVDESSHRVDALLTHLLNTGSLARAAGIVVGEMTRSDERIDEGIGGRPWREIVRERLGPLGVPCILDFPFGHMKDMLSLPLGVRARLDAKRGTLEYMEAHCE